MELILQPKQMEVLNSPATEILYGGAAYGGKSYLLRALAISLCYDIPGLQVYLFRRNYGDLIMNHMNGSMSFPEMLAPFIASKQVSVKELEITWSNGSKIHLCHCQHEKDVTKYQGAEIHVLLVDELTHFSEYIYRFLRNRVRLGSRLIPDRWKNKLPLIVNGSNPGSVGHAWVKRSFIEMMTAGDVVRMSKEEGGMLRQFIQSRSDDNPIGLRNDPGYMDRLSGLGSEDLVKAMRDGNWDIVAGAAFENLNREIHSIRAFDLPSWWTKFTSLDWGSAKPYSVGWYAVADDTVVLKGRDGAKDQTIGKGSIIIYRELYGWNGKPNEGCREESWQVAKKIAAMEDETINYRIADNAMWAEHDGPSIAERMMDALEAEEASCPNMEQSRKDRKANYLEIRARIANSDGENPGLYIFDTCHHFWRTIPDLQLDQRDPEKGWDGAQEDHWCFPAGTPIITSSGIKPIELVDNDIVLTSQGWQSSISLGVSGVHNTIKITLSDGFEFEATPNHPILTPSGTYARLDSLLVGSEVLCVSKLYQILNRCLMVSHIGCVAGISKGMANAFIELFGNIVMEPFRMVFMCIISTMTRATTRLRILSLCISHSIWRNIWPSKCKVHFIVRNLGDISKKQERLLKNGIHHLRVSSGIRLIAKRFIAEALDSFACVRYAVMNLSPIIQILDFVQRNVRLKTSVRIIRDISVESAKPVYNLSVPTIKNYCLGNGLIVHNCDQLGYALVSRPILMDRITHNRLAYDEARQKSFQADRGSVNGSRY